MLKILSLFYLFFLLPAAIAEQKIETKQLSISEFADQMHNAWLSGQPLPHISKHINRVTDKQASIAQFLFVQKQTLSYPLNQAGNQISGFKAGLTSRKSQIRFSINQPVSGVLLETGNLEKVQPIQLSQYFNLMLETEVAFLLAQDIDKPIQDINILKEKIAAVMPAIEMPDLAFADPTKITSQDIIASNVSANKYLLGKKIQMPVSFLLNQIKTTLEHSVNGKKTMVNQGLGKNAQGDQWQALQWLVNECLESGYHLRKGQFLITGALGKMIPAQVGNYHADFGSLGSIDFTMIK